MVEGATFAVLGAVLGLLCARHWGPQIAGVSSLALSMAALCGMVAQLGLDQVVILRFVHETNPLRLLKVVLLLRMVSTLLALLGLLASSAVFASQLGPWWGLPLLAFLQNVVVSADVLRLRAQALQTLHRQSPWRILVALLFFAAKLNVLLGEPAAVSVWGVAGLQLAEAVALLIVSILVSRAGGVLRDVEAAANIWTDARELARASLPLCAAGFAVLAFFRLDYLSLAALADTYQLGLYASSMRLLELYLAVGSLLLTQFLPQLARAHQGSAADYAHALRACFGLAYAMAGGILLFNALLGRPLILWALGEAYAPVADVSMTMCLLSVPLLSGTVRGFAISIQGLHAHHLYCALLGLGLGLPLLAYGIPMFGFRGAIWVDGVTHTVSAMLSSLLFPALREIGKAQWQPTFRLTRGGA